MTWLSLVTAVTIMCGFVGMGILSLLGASVRAQGAGTTKQTTNRRMLTIGASFCGAAVVIPFVAMGWVAAFYFALGWLAVAVLLGAMFASRRPTVLVAMLLFLSAALFAVVSLPPHMGSVDAVGAFVVAGLLLAKLTRVAAHHIAGAGQLH
jgi:hypothetical protein